MDILVGKILKPQGIKGEIKVKGYTDDLKCFLDFDYLLIDGEKYLISNVRISDFVYIYFKGINERNQAELLRNKEVFVKRKDIVLKEGCYLVGDILGLDLVFEDFEKVGVISDITSGKVDVYEVKTKDAKKILFPLLDDLLIKFDLENKRVIINKKRFYEVCVLED